MLRTYFLTCIFCLFQLLSSTLRSKDVNRRRVLYLYTAHKNLSLCALYSLVLYICVLLIV